MDTFTALNAFREALGNGQAESEVSVREQAPDPKTPPESKVQEAYDLLKGYVDSQRRLFELVESLEALLPPKEKKKLVMAEELRKDHVGEGSDDQRFALSEVVRPTPVALVMLHEFFGDPGRFLHQDPSLLPRALEANTKVVRPQPDHSNISLGPHNATVPDAADLWLTDLRTGLRLTATYNVGQNGVALVIRCRKDRRDAAVGLLNEVKDSISCCPYIKGQVLEIFQGGIKVLEDMPEQQFPVIDRSLRDELEKNVLNMFDKADEFRRYRQPVKRAVILQGSPGCGKTLLCRWLTKTLKGKVTVFWVTAKSIQNQLDVSTVFDMARKLSPSMVIMEDMDLISGTRASFVSHGSGALGELLNQLDGLDPNDSLVVVATTNEVNSLDPALNDRPGRFDRIYKVGLPDPEAAQGIARGFLRSRGLSERHVDQIDYGPVMTGLLSGAQVVEVMKGAIFEAVHAGSPVTTLCVRRSAKGLEDQRKSMGILKDP